MINNIKNFFDCVSDSITFVIVLIGLIRYINKTLSRLLEGNDKKLLEIPTIFLFVTNFIFLNNFPINDRLLYL